jgi:heme-degrading monooxygenase HmoA
MTTIVKGAKPVTLINVFEVDPTRQEELIALLNQATANVMSTIPGFVSANIHRSLDGRRVVNYAQWQTREQFEAMLHHSAAREHMDKAAAVARSVAPALYEVVETFEGDAVEPLTDA